jgi:polyadenylate-binding protein
MLTRFGEAFRHDPTYRVDALDLKRTDMSGHDGRNKHDEEYLRRYELDRRSVFVGNLPENITQEDIAALFSQVGEVQSVQLIKRGAVQGKSPTSRGSKRGRRELTILRHASIWLC